MLNIGEPIQTYDLAQTLEGDSGSYLWQPQGPNGGQQFLVAAAEGHSIKSIRPIGVRTIENQNAASLGSMQPGTVTKLSSQDVSDEFRRQQNQPGSRRSQQSS